MDTHFAICIGRQYGSGGSEIGRKLAERLGFGYYDKELITIAAQKNGLCPEIFERNDEKATITLSYALTSKYCAYAVNPMGDFLSSEKLFEFQSLTIQQLAGEKSCIFIGRCADYVLREMPNMVSFFISDRLENRVQRIAQKYQLPENEAKSRVKKIDKSRCSFYNFFSDKKWGEALSYNYCIDVSVLGLNGTVDLMEQMIRTLINTKKNNQL